MKFVPSINPFFCYLQAGKLSVVILWSVAFYYPSCLDWINRGKHRSNVFQWNLHSGSFFYLFSLTATEGTCSGLEYSGWSIPVSLMLVLVTLSFQRNLSFFFGLFQHVESCTLNRACWIVMLLYAQRYFLHITYCCLHSTKISSRAGEGNLYNILAFIPLWLQKCIEIIIVIMASYI